MGMEATSRPGVPLERTQHNAARFPKARPQCTCVHAYTCNTFWTETADMSVPCPGDYVRLPSSSPLPQTPMDHTARQCGEVRQSSQGTGSSGRKYHLLPPPSPAQPSTAQWSFVNFPASQKALSLTIRSLYSPVTLEEGGQASQGQGSRASQ